ncbi:MAG: insulinase family protein [Proteobacteria bacterium]|nr:insulinase family protein [Pseudomonadota bacterium]
MKGIAFEDDDFHAASVFSTLLGGGMSSRLFQEVREKRGLAYSIYSFLSSYTDGGLFGVYAGTGKDDVRDLVPLVLGEIGKLAAGGAKGGAEDAEIDRARAQIKASILMSLESTAARCEQLARQMIVFKRPIPIDETIAKIDAVDGAAIRRVAERLLSGPTTITALGPVPDLEELEKLAAK